VVGLDAACGTVQLGDEEDLLASGAALADPVWSDDVALPFEAEVRVRSRHDGERAIVDRERDPKTGEERIVARFVTPVRAVSPGQIAVAYRGDRVLGGATITGAIGAREGAGP